MVAVSPNPEMNTLKEIKVAPVSVDFAEPFPETIAHIIFSYCMQPTPAFIRSMADIMPNFMKPYLKAVEKDSILTNWTAQLLLEQKTEITQSGALKKIFPFLQNFLNKHSHGLQAKILLDAHHYLYVASDDNSFANHSDATTEEIRDEIINVPNHLENKTEKEDFKIGIETWLNRVLMRHYENTVIRAYDTSHAESCDIYEIKKTPSDIPARLSTLLSDPTQPENENSTPECISMDHQLLYEKNVARNYTIAAGTSLVFLLAQIIGGLVGLIVTTHSPKASKSDLIPYALLLAILPISLSLACYMTYQANSHRRTKHKLESVLQGFLAIEAMEMLKADAKAQAKQESDEVYNINATFIHVPSKAKTPKDELIFFPSAPHLFFKVRSRHTEVKSDDEEKKLHGCQNISIWFKW